MAVKNVDIWKKFEANNLTHSAAHHLLAVMDLREQSGYARVTDVAKLLNITTGSASTNLKNLKNKGLVVEDDNKFLKLSEKGEELARAVVARRNIFKKLLVSVLGVSEKQATIDACKTEHLISHETSEKMLNYLKSHKNGKTDSLQTVHDCDHAPNVDCQVCEERCLMEDC